MKTPGLSTGVNVETLRIVHQPLEPCWARPKAAGRAGNGAYFFAANAFFSSSAANCSASLAFGTTAPMPKNSWVTPLYSL